MSKDASLAGETRVLHRPVTISSSGAHVRAISSVHLQGVCNQDHLTTLIVLRLTYDAVLPSADKRRRWRAGSGVGAGSVADRMARDYEENRSAVRRTRCSGE
jgi:hypothetical protein